MGGRPVCLGTVRGQELETVQRLLYVYLPLARDVGLPDHMIAAHAMRSRLLFWHGDVDGASRVLTELETLGHLRKLPESSPRPNSSARAC